MNGLIVGIERRQGKNNGRWYTTLHFLADGNVRDSVEGQAVFNLNVQPSCKVPFEVGDHVDLQVYFDSGYHTWNCLGVNNN